MPIPLQPRGCSAAAGLQAARVRASGRRGARGRRAPAVPAPPAPSQSRGPAIGRQLSTCCGTHPQTRSHLFQEGLSTECCRCKAANQGAARTAARPSQCTPAMRTCIARGKCSWNHVLMTSASAARSGRGARAGRSDVSRGPISAGGRQAHAPHPQAAQPGIKGWMLRVMLCGQPRQCQYSGGTAHCLCSRHPGERRRPPEPAQQGAPQSCLQAGCLRVRHARLRPCCPRPIAESAAHLPVPQAATQGATAARGGLPLPAAAAAGDRS